MLDCRVLEARYVSGHVVWLRAHSRIAKQARSISDRLSGVRYSSLYAIPSCFGIFDIHPEFHALVWPNGADFAPEFLHDNIRAVA